MRGYYGKLGMDVVCDQHSNMDTFLTIKNIWSDGVVAAWNKQVAAELQIHVGDRIVSINGCTDGRLMHMQADSAGVLKLIILNSSAARARTAAIDAAKRDMRTEEILAVIAPPAPTIEHHQ